MGINDIPLKSAEARKLAEHDAEVLNAARPPGFRFERTQLRFQVALRNGLSQREAERLEQLAQPPSRTAQWLRSLRRSWASARAGWAVGVLAAASAAFVVWTTTRSELGEGIARSPATTLELVAGVQVTRHDFADGSSIVLMPGAQGRLEQRGQSVHFDLEQGLALFDVTHLPDRITNPEWQWRVTAGHYEVTVVGTTFSVRFDAVAGFEVEVQRGAVAVRVPDQDAALQVNAGELLTATRDAVTLRHPDWRGTLARAEAQPGSRAASNTESAASAQKSDDSAAGSHTSAASPETAEPLARSKRGASRGARQPVAPSDDVVAGPSAHSHRSANAPPQEREELVLLSRARQALAADQPSRALNWIDVHGRRFAKGHLSEEREALRVEALRHVGRDEEARRAAGEFKRRFPKSVLTKQMPADAP